LVAGNVTMLADQASLVSVTRKIDPEGRPAIRRAVGPDEALALLDDPVHGLEAAPGGVLLVRSCSSVATTTPADERLMRIAFATGA
jgi:hypothetical protein